MPYFRAINISRGTTRPEYAGTITNLKVVLNTHKNPYLNQALQKNSCQKFSYPKNPEIKYFKPEKSFDYPSHLKSGVPPRGFKAYSNTLFPDSPVDFLLPDFSQGKVDL